MKLNPSLHAEHQLDQLAGQFEHWRHTRVAKHLRLSSNDLKKHMAAQHESRAAAPPTPPGFVEVLPVPARPTHRPARDRD